MKTDKTHIDQALKMNLKNTFLSLIELKELLNLDVLKFWLCNKMYCAYCGIVPK